MKQKSIIRTLSLFLAILLAYAACYKLLTFKDFQYQLNKTIYFTGYSTLIACCIPVLELLAAALLVRGITRLAGLFGAFFLINIYTIYLLAMLQQGHQMPCDCGELWPVLTLGQHLLFNLAIIVVSSAAVILSGRSGYQAGELYH